MIVKVLSFAYIVAWKIYFVESVKLVDRGLMQRLMALLSYQTVLGSEALK